MEAPDPRPAPPLDDPELSEELEEPEATSSEPPSLEGLSVETEGNGKSFPPQAATRSSAGNPARRPVLLPMAPKN